MLPRPHRLAVPLALAGVLGILFSAGAARAQLTVDPTVTPSGALFDYSYTVTNLMTDDFPVITLSVPAQPDGITNLVAPAGFTIGPFDSGLGLVSFSEDSQVFTATPVGPFTFSSAFGPVASQFQALDASTGGTVVGSTMTPGVPAVPEASTLIPFAAGTLLLTIYGARRRSAARVAARSHS